MERCALENNGFIGVWYPGNYRTDVAIIAAGGASCDEKTSVSMCRYIEHMMQPAQIVSYLFIGIPLVLLIIYVLRGKTVLKKRSQFFTPLLWMALLSGLKFIVPATPFSNGIDTFCMNAGLIIWFVYLIAAKAER